MRYDRLEMTSEAETLRSFSHIDFFVANVRGLRSKKDQLELYFSESPKIAVLTEVSGTKSLFENEFRISNYNVQYSIRGNDSAEKKWGWCLYLLSQFS